MEMNSKNPLTLVVFGATGDLYQNKLALALFNLFSQGFLPKDFTVFGFARRALTDLDFQNFTKDALEIKSSNLSQESLQEFLSHLKYIQGDLESLEDFKKLAQQLGEEDGKLGVCTNKLFYLAVPPSMYGKIFQNISDAGLTITCAPGTLDVEEAWTRVLVEKPFGSDIEDAKRLDKMLGGLFAESQIFRIDHYLAYLAKGVVDAILNLRFGVDAAESKETKWSNKNIESVRIIFHEKDLVGRRAPFYDALGAFRDVGQNHMLQMLALVAMENPLLPETGGIHKARQSVLEKVKIQEKLISSPYHGQQKLTSPEFKMVRGQYEGYLGEAGVKPESETETFFRLVLTVENPKWAGVPFVLEFGKALDESQVFIEVCSKESKTCMNFPVSDENTLRDAYEKVFYDCILGDQTIFASTGEVMAEWVITTEVLKALKSVPLVVYKKGSSADAII